MPPNPTPHDAQRPPRAAPEVPIVAGWMQYYGRFYPSLLYPLLRRINAYLVRWIRNKYRRYDSTRQARRKLGESTLGYLRLFRHWRWVSTAW